MEKYAGKKKELRANYWPKTFKQAVFHTFLGKKKGKKERKPG
jgi:hypothetical protein